MARKSAAERRDEALSAARAIITRDGIMDVSVRKVAEEAGMSAGSLRHIFPSQADLFVALLEDGEAVARRRMTDLAHRARPDATTYRRLAREMIIAVSPFTEATRADALTQLAVIIAHPGVEELRTAREGAGRALDEMCRAILAWSEITDQRIREELALELRLFIDGLMLRLFERDDFSEEEALAAVDRTLDRLRIPETALGAPPQSRR